MWLGVLALTTSAVFVISSAGASSASQARLDKSSKHHTHHSTHKPTKGKTEASSVRPCLEGNWNVGSITLATSGLSFVGGAGTTVDIMSNGNAVGNFTPGSPLVAGAGSAKFNGTITDHYGFSSKTTARSGSFSVTNVTDNATITVAGRTQAVSPSPEQGSYTCSGKNLSLVFTSGGTTLTYQMAPAS
jgi:hypothetical protein